MEEEEEEGAHGGEHPPRDAPDDPEKEEDDRVAGLGEALRRLGHGAGELEALRGLHVELSAVLGVQALPGSATIDELRVRVRDQQAEAGPAKKAAAASAEERTQRAEMRAVSKSAADAGEEPGQKVPISSKTRGSTAKTPQTRLPGGTPKAGRYGGKKKGADPSQTKLQFGTPPGSAGGSSTSVAPPLLGSKRTAVAVTEAARTTSEFGSAGAQVGGIDPEVVMDDDDEEEGAGDNGMGLGFLSGGTGGLALDFEEAGQSSEEHGVDGGASGCGQGGEGFNRDGAGGGRGSH